MPDPVVPTPQEIAEPAAGGRWRAILAVEGTPTSDGRMFMPGSITWRELPLTLKAQLVDAEGHLGAVIAGNIDKITRAGANIIGEGEWDTSEQAQEVKRLVDDEMLRGVSVDISPLKVEYEVPALAQPMYVEEIEPGEEPAAPNPDEIPKETITESVGDYMMRVLEGELGAATICTFPAFAGATIETLVASGARDVVRYTRNFDLLDAAAFADVPSPAETKPPAGPDPSKPKAAPRDGDPTKPAVPVPGSSGAMIALRPAPGEADALHAAKPDGHAAQDLHVTLAHLTDDGASITPEQEQAIKESMDSVAGEHPALVGKVGGHGTFATPDGYANVHLADVPHVARLRESLTAGLRARGVEYSASHGFTPHLTHSYSDDVESGDPAAHGVGLSFTSMELHKAGKIVHTAPLTGLPPQSITASAAGLVPVEPPSDWFFEPEADEPTPLTVTDDGRVYGHVAQWDVCHLGLPGKCTTAPRSRAGYAYFHLGEVRCGDGERVAAGTIAMRTRHAPHSYSRAQTTDHYDHTGTAAADVRAVDGRWGIWVAGALRPDLPVERVREFRSSKPSGDWREINGALEMVGCLAVNVPGFPVVRPSVVVAGGSRRLSLVAAGTADPHLTDRWHAARAKLYSSPALVDRRVSELALRLAPR